jgi:hypothetical protein
MMAGTKTPYFGDVGDDEEAPKAGAIPYFGDVGDDAPPAGAPDIAVDEPGFPRSGADAVPGSAGWTPQEREYIPGKIPGVMDYLSGAAEGAGSLLSKAGEYTGEMVKAAIGQNEFTDLPEARSWLSHQIENRDISGDERRRYRRASIGLLTSFGDDQERKAIKNEFPGARFKEDKYGNTIVSIGSETIALNKGGWSVQDTQQMATLGVIVGVVTSPVARLGKAVANTTGRIIGTISGGVLGEHVADVAGRGARGEDFNVTQINLGKAMAVGGTILAFEITVPLLGHVLKKVYGGVTKNGYMKRGRLTPKGRDVLKKSGINVDGMTQEQTDRLVEASRRFDGDPSAGVRQSEAESMLVPTTLSPAQAGRRNSDLMFESEGKKGTHGKEIEDRLMTQQRQQQEDLAGNVPANQAALTGGTVRNAGEGSAEVQAALNWKLEKFKRAVDYIYEKAKGFEAHAPRQLGDDVATRMRQTLAEENLSLTSNEGINTLASKFYQLVDAKTLPVNRPGFTASTRSVKPETISINKMETWRQTVSQAKRDTKDLGKQRILGNMLRDYDEIIEGELKDAMLSGSDVALDMWRKARSVRRLQAKFFGEDDVVNTLTTRLSDGSGRLKHHPDQAVNYIFGRAALGKSPTLARDLDKLKLVLGENSAEWQAIREEGFLRLFKTAKAGNFNSKTYNNALDGAMKDAPTVMRTLYSPEELARFQTLGYVAKNISEGMNVVGNTQASNTASGVAQFVNKMVAGSGFAGRAIDAVLRQFLEKTIKSANNRRANAAASGRLDGMPMRRPAPGVSGAAGVMSEKLLNGP